MDLSFLPAVNASLNGLATLLLVVGLVLIKLQKREAHKKAMLAAFTCSGVFLVFYLLHYAWRASVKGGVHTVYNGPMGKPFYYTLLISHILLAITVPVFAIALIRLGLKERYETHKKVARIAWPIWFYVSVTGVVIYFMLYHFNGPKPGPGATGLGVNDDDRFGRVQNNETYIPRSTQPKSESAGVTVPAEPGK